MESPRPRRRLKAKTAVAAMPQATVVGRPLSPEPEAPQARQALGAREVFLVTFPHPKKERSEDGYPLTAPGSLSKADVLDRLLNACQSPVYLDAKNILACPPVPLLKTGIFQGAPQGNRVLTCSPSRSCAVARSARIPPLGCQAGVATEVRACNPLVVQPRWLLVMPQVRGARESREAFCLSRRSSCTLVSRG